MPINHAIWTVDANPQPLAITRLPSEAFLEDMIINRPEILSGEWMLAINIPKTGYVGVRRVLEPVQSANEFTVPTPDGDRLAVDVVRDGEHFRKRGDDL